MLLGGGNMEYLLGVGSGSIDARVRGICIEHL